MIGQTKDVGFNIGVSKTLPRSPESVWHLLTGPDGIALWLGKGAQLEPRKGAPYRTD